MTADCHAHTVASYCAERDMLPEAYVSALKGHPDCDAVVIADHTMAIYFPQEVAWKWEFITDSRVYDRHRDAGSLAFERHLAMLKAYEKDGLLPGLETEMMHDGRFDFDPAFRSRLSVLIGSVHWLPDNKDRCAPDIIVKSWLDHTLRLIDSGIDLLGHPFRWLAYQVPQVDKALIKTVVARAKAAGVAVELNSHYKIEADEEMLKEALSQGAAIALSSDSHRRDEILDLSYHKALLQKLGLRMDELRAFKPRSL